MHPLRSSKSDNARKKAYKNPLQALSKHCPVFYVTNSLHVPYLIKRDSMKNKKTKIRTHSRRRSYGKKGTRRQLTQRKQHAIEPARVREAKPIENVNSTDTKTPTEEKIPWRSPRSEPDPGTYACRTITGGCVVSFFLLGFFISCAAGDPWMGLYFLIPGLLCLIPILKDFSKSRGGW